MTDRHRRWRTALLLGLALVTPGIALADPDGGWLRHSRRDCPRTDYSPLHYWAPSLYQVRACLRPSDLDQYPPGPFPPVPATFDVNKYKCRTIPPIPTAPYADPTSYYGRAVAPP